MSHFTIQCRKCGKELQDVYCAFCEHCIGSLLVTEYKEKEFKKDNREGIWKFNWLPVHSPGFRQPGPVVYRSERFAALLGLENLYLAINGYWPEMGGSLESCTFKEYEAAVVLQNAIENGVEGLVVASAGNTARAFSYLSVISGFPVIIVVPKMCLLEMWYLESSLVIPTLAITDGDYADAIDVAKRIAQTVNIPFEGGVKNIAKRDGLGVVLLEAVSVIGRLPRHYFQAVGSGTGAIGVWEMAERFQRSGGFGSSLPRLHLAQNLPFAPMVKAWHRKSRDLLPEDLRPELISGITTRVLSNRYPAYTVLGGVYDALRATQGIMYGIMNDEVFDAMDRFERAEGIDIVPAAGVAVAALMRAAREGRIKKDETILLNITGAGEVRYRKEKGRHVVNPVYISRNISEREIEELVCGFLKTN